MRSEHPSRHKIPHYSRSKALKLRQAYQIKTNKRLQRLHWLNSVLKQLNSNPLPAKQRYLLEVGLQAYLD